MYRPRTHTLLAAGIVVAALAGCGGGGGPLTGSTATQTDTTTQLDERGKPKKPRHDRYGDNVAIDGLAMFAGSAWTTDVSSWPVDELSTQILTRIGLTASLHPDFGSGSDGWNNGQPYGIPYTVVGRKQAPVDITFTVADESDPGPYPIPPTAPIETGGDHHVIVLDRDHGLLYEVFAAVQQPADLWHGYAGARFSIREGDAQRPIYWTSADAAGLPMLPGLVRADEVIDEGAIDHAVRFTCSPTRRGFVWPASHWASSYTDADLPPMGLRVRLKAGYNTSGFPPQARVILEALKRYGMILADNGGDFYLSGAPDARWIDSDLGLLKQVKGSDFEVVEMGEVVTSYGKTYDDYGSLYQ